MADLIQGMKDQTITIMLEDYALEYIVGLYNPETGCEIYTESYCGEGEDGESEVLVRDVTVHLPYAVSRDLPERVVLTCKYKTEADGDEFTCEDVLLTVLPRFDRGVTFHD